MGEPDKTFRLAVERLSSVLLLVISVGYPMTGTADDKGNPSSQTETDVALSETCDLDFPAGRCGGHANTGIRWTAPEPTTARVEGRVWKIRERGIPVELSLWVNGRKLIDRALVRGRSDSTYPLSRMLADQGRKGTDL